jgi:hypothetical protein
MSMFVRSVSAYQQLQNWSASQANITSQQLGSASTQTDYSSAFTNAAYNSLSTGATLAADEALSRVQGQAAAKSSSSSSASSTASQSSSATPGSSSSSTSDARLAAAQAAGATLLSGLGMDYATMYGASSSSSSSSSTSASQTYSAPTNSQTGYAYVATDAANLNDLNTVNFLT